MRDLKVYLRAQCVSSEKGMKDLEENLTKFYDNKVAGGREDEPFLNQIFICAVLISRSNA